MRLGGLEQLREALGGRNAAGELTVGLTYASALKQAAGMKGTRLFDVDAAIKWREEHPKWVMTEVYPRKSPGCNRSGRSVSTAGRCGALS